MWPKDCPKSRYYSFYIKMTFLKRAQKFPNIWTTFVKKLLFTPLKIAQSGVINTSHGLGGYLCVA